MHPIPSIRLRIGNHADENPHGDYVLYWMIANRRTRFNFSLQHAVCTALRLRKPLIVLEALRVGYPWASDRIHQFVMQGMADNAGLLQDAPVLYYPYLEPRHDDGKGLLQKLSERACLVVTDDFPCFFLPGMVQAAASRLTVRLDIVDSNGLLPLRATNKVFRRAVDFRRFLQKNLVPHLFEFPQFDPLAGVRLPVAKLPKSIAARWPVASLVPGRKPWELGDFPIDHSVAALSQTGGSTAGETAIRTFVADRLAGYESRNQPDEPVVSGLSPYLHFGHVAAHQVFSEVMNGIGWSPDRVAEKATGSREGWWGASAAAEAFLDQLVTWRELGFNMCWQRTDYDTFDSLPDWARQTLNAHESDPREYVYDLEQFESAATHDPLWNAAQRQLVRDGMIHNYLRMLWGKKILEWSDSPRAALQIMIELNNKYAMDGRDPNSYSGIFWVLGRYDRAWGPERPIFGKIRYMSSENTARKLKVANYLRQYGP